MTYIRDASSGAVINTDDSHYKTILLRRQEKKQSEEVCEQLRDLRTEMEEIKSLLTKVINGKNYG